MIRKKNSFVKASLQTLSEWLSYSVSEYERHGVALGQVSTSAHDEALYLLLRTLDLPLTSDKKVLRKKLSATQISAVKTMLHRRTVEHIPAGYLTREAFLGEHRFYVDERVILPRSYFLEIIPQQLPHWLPEGLEVKRVVDVCTGSGCLAILLAHQFPSAKVDAIDLSKDALSVAAINLDAHGMTEQIRLLESDVFDRVPKAKYDVILSNPPYEPTAHVDAMPEEFHREPRMALDGGKDGLAIVRKILLQALPRLQPHGIVVLEVGGLRSAIEKEFAHLDPHWLHTDDGTDCICVIHAANLKKPGLRDAKRK